MVASLRMFVVRGDDTKQAPLVFDNIFMKLFQNCLAHALGNIQILLLRHITAANVAPNHHYAHPVSTCDFTTPMDVSIQKMAP